MDLNLLLTLQLSLTFLYKIKNVLYISLVALLCPGHLSIRGEWLRGYKGHTADNNPTNLINHKCNRKSALFKFNNPTNVIRSHKCAVAFHNSLLLWRKLLGFMEG